MKKRLARFAVICAALLLVKAAWMLACEPRGQDDVLARRDYLVARVTSPSFSSDHALSPGGIFASEWRLVTLSMTAAALVHIAYAVPETRRAALEQCRLIVEQTLSPPIRSFELHAWGSDPLDDLDGPLGHVGYLGHLNLVLGAYRVLGGDRRWADLHDAVSEALARRMRASPSFHLETYPGEIYTADNSVGVASLAVHAMVTGASHAETVAGWVAYTRAHLLDPESGLIVFQVGLDGTPGGRGRGSAAGYNSFYLPFVDRGLAEEQFARLREHLLTALPFGAAAVREHPSGAGLGDVDSGPLVFGLSPSATGFALAGARHAGDEELVRALLRTAEGAGFTVPARGGRCYALAPLVGDAIVLAARTATAWDLRYAAR